MNARIPPQRFLARLIWICVLPLLLATYLAYDSVREHSAELDREAANIAQNFGVSLDQHLAARTAPLGVLAASPTAADERRRAEFHEEAQAFQQGFGGHVILADLELKMLFNTRLPLGAPMALETGAPAIGPSFIGPVADELEYRARVRSGEIRRFHTSGRAGRDADGRATYLAGTTFDTTARKQAEAEVQKQNEHAEQEKQLGIVRNASRQLLALTNDVLDISKVKAGEPSLAREKFDLGSVPRRLAATFAPEAGRRGLEFALDIPAGDLRVIGDERRVGRILNNLMFDALKFTPRGSVTVNCTRR